MTHRIIPKEEIIRNKISAVGARVALHAEQENGNYEDKMSRVDDLITDLYKHDLTFEPEDDVASMRSVIMGTLHACEVAPTGFEGTATMGNIISRMGSAYRPSVKNTDDPIYMITAVTDAVIVEVVRSDGTVVPELRHQLKTDLSSVLNDFRMLRREGAEREAASRLFSVEELQI